VTARGSRATGDATGVGRGRSVADGVSTEALRQAPRALGCPGGGSIAGTGAGDVSRGRTSSGVHDMAVDHKHPCNDTAASLASQPYATAAEGKLAATQSDATDAWTSWTALPTPEASTSKHAREPRPTTASQTAGAPEGEPPRAAWPTRPLVTAAMAVGFVSQHVAGSDDRKEQQAITVPTSIASSC